MSDSNDNAKTAGKWNFAALCASAAIAGVLGIVGANLTMQKGKQLDENQVCLSEYKPSNIKAVETEKFLEYSNSKLYAKWNEQSAVIDYIANGMERNEAEVKARREFASLNDRLQDVKKYIENEPEISLTELQKINKGLSSDCMKSYKEILRKIYDDERMNR